MSKAELIFLILVIAAMGGQIGYALGIYKTYKVLIPVIDFEREEVARLKLLARLGGAQTAPRSAEIRETEGLDGGAQ